MVGGGVKAVGEDGGGVERRKLLGCRGGEQSLHGGGSCTGRGEAAGGMAASLTVTSDLQSRTRMHGVAGRFNGTGSSVGETARSWLLLAVTSEPVSKYLTQYICRKTKTK